ncbi:thioesterase superfamily protein [Thermaerobacter marianensis DSM 12885]|uniref:Thioesterase superfamily protein n=2 Tax=Thermaerobacter marianensis TaxID=73919 RepID=E6SJ24_THEM7|nr:thioesterase family protein [Thermaerobacter marianensis]ADU52048.1 thioesterase superfamily protein [Thermaerobacter marianensis DSM 12885]
MPQDSEPRIVRSPLRVRFAETDAQGVVYYGNYFVYFEVGRVDLLREARGARDPDEPAAAAADRAGGRRQGGAGAAPAAHGAAGDAARDTLRDAERGGGIGALVVAHAECDYRASARFDDRLEVQTWIEALGRTSMTFGHRVVRLPDGEELARGRVVAVHVGANGRPQPIPDDWRPVLERYLLPAGAPVTR